MSWAFPLLNYKYAIPEGTHPGAFLKKRRNHKHEGIYLYSEEGAPVVAVEKGKVYRIIDFTGTKAKSPWWNDTKAIIVKGKSGYVLYGEVTVNNKIKEGDIIEKGQLIARVKQVLKKRKSNPPAMLHFELYSKEVDEPIELIFSKRDRDSNHDSLIEEKGLMDPTSKLKKALEKKEKVLLMVCGSISAYKAPDIARALLLSGKKVKVVLSKGAENFVNKDVFKYLDIECYDYKSDFKNEGVLHIKLARWADRVLIAPATANTIGKLARGLSDCLLTSIYISLKDNVEKQILPIMNTEMLNNKIVKDNIKKLRQKTKAIILKSDIGFLACGEEGAGKLPKVEKLAYISNLVNSKNINKKVVITAGATIAPIDTIRYVTNPAKGATGLLLAEKFLKEGFSVTVICNKNSLEKFKWLGSHPNYKRVEVVTTRDLAKAVSNEKYDIYISTMAVSDFEFKMENKKLKKKGLTVLKPNIAPDVLKEVLNKRKTNSFIVGFAAETSLTKEVLDEKFKRKPVDLLVANVADGGFGRGKSKGFGSSRGEYKLISNRGVEEYITDKKEIIEKIYSNIIESYEVK